MAAHFQAVGVWSGMGVGALSGAAIGGATSVMSQGLTNILSGQKITDGLFANILPDMVTGAVMGGGYKVVLRDISLQKRMVLTHGIGFTMVQNINTLTMLRIISDNLTQQNIDMPMQLQMRYKILTFPLLLTES